MIALLFLSVEICDTLSSVEVIALPVPTCSDPPTRVATSVWIAASGRSERYSLNVLSGFKVVHSFASCRIVATCSPGTSRIKKFLIVGINPVLPVRSFNSFPTGNFSVRYSMAASLPPYTADSVRPSPASLALPNDVPPVTADSAARRGAGEPDAIDRGNAIAVSPALSTPLQTPLSIGPMPSVFGRNLWATLRRDARCSPNKLDSATPTSGSPVAFDIGVVNLESTSAPPCPSAAMDASATWGAAPNAPTKFLPASNSMRFVPPNCR